MNYELRIVNLAMVRAGLAISSLLFMLGNSSFLSAQQPQAPANAPLYSVNAKYVNGLAPGYWPVAGSGLTLTLSPGTAYCGNPPQPVPYPGGALAMSPSATNYVYLGPTGSCAPASNTTGFSVGDIPIAQVVTGASSITTITDERTWFLPNPIAMSSSGEVQISSRGANQRIALTPSGTGTTQITNLVDKGGQVYNVKAYGAVGSGTTDDTAAIQSAVAAIRVATGDAAGSGPKYTAKGTLFLPPGIYKVSQLDLTDTQGLRIIGAGRQATEIECSEASAGTGICLDMSGSSNAVVEGFRIGDDANGPEVELLTGKTAQNPDANYNYFSIQMGPTTATYGFYNYGSEDMTIVDPVWWATGSSSVPLVISAVNSAGVASAFSTLASGGQSMSHMSFLGGRIVSAGPEAVLIDDWNGTTFKPPINIHFFGTYFGLTGASTIGITDPSGAPATGVLHNYVVDSRFEFDGGAGNQAINLHASAQNWEINSTYGSVAAPTNYPYNFAAHLIGSIALIYGNDTGPAHSGGAIYAHTDEGSMLNTSVALGSPGASSNPGSIDNGSGYTYMKRYYLPGNPNQYIYGGNGTPTGSCQTGSMYLDASGGAGTTLYVCEAGTWVAK